MDDLIENAITYLESIKEDNLYVYFPDYSYEISAPTVSKEKSFLKRKSITIETKPKPSTSQKPAFKAPTKETPKGFAIQKPTLQDDLQGMKEHVKKHLPYLFIHENIPDDIVAKKRMERWKVRSHMPKIPIFVNKQVKEFATFLQNLAKAIDVRFGFCHLVDISKIEEEMQWQNALDLKQLKLIITAEKTLFSAPHLLSMYQENNDKTSCSIAGVPTIVLDALSDYENNANKKRDLWNSILQILGSNDV